MFFMEMLYIQVQKKYISSVNGSRSVCDTINSLPSYSCSTACGFSTNADLSEEVEHLCGAIEAMFLHELKNSKVLSLSSFSPMVTMY